jgi:hypothetical protein
MNLKRTLVALCFAAGVPTAAFAHVGFGVVVGVPPPVRVVAYAPAPVVTYVPTPRYGHVVWVPGHWAWHRGHYVWVRGHWVRHKHRHAHRHYRHYDPYAYRY